MAFHLIPSVPVAELSDDSVLLDVREADEWAAGRAVGAVHIPMSEITDRVADLPVGDDVVIVCHVGGRSARVTAWLLQQDYPCRNLDGGMVAYAAAGLPLEADGDRVPMVDWVDVGVRSPMNTRESGRTGLRGRLPVADR